MFLGVDFDNTIVSYDRVFHMVARELGVVPDALPPTKAAVQGHLIGQGREAVWTEMQGHVYGTRMLDALPFPGVLDVFRLCARWGVPVAIVSHKTRHPYLGPCHDLHRAAHGWLEHHGFYDPDRLGLGRDRVYFELTKSDKLGRIGQLGCSHFLDDLPDVLGAPEFPSGVRRLLFDPNGRYPGVSPYTRVSGWDEVGAIVGAGQGSVA
jgi:hypothetical protein